MRCKGLLMIGAIGLLAPTIFWAASQPADSMSAFGETAEPEQQATQRGGHHPDMGSLFEQAAANVCDPPFGCPVSDFTREELVGNLVHYSAIVQVGPGEYDRIGLHRVVRENPAGHILPTKDNLFLQHGDIKNFVGMFLPALYSPTTDPEFGLAIYLAREQADVWGIDQGWTLLTPDIPDFSFLQDWGLQRQVDDLRSALAVTREVRRLTGEGGGPLNLLGHSSGGATGYALINHEAALPAGQRHVAAYVVADMSYLSTDPDWTASNCYYALEDFGPTYDAGEYVYDFGFSYLGQLARDFPDDPTPLGFGLTNLETALWFGTADFGFDTPAHYLAGEFDESGMCTGLQYMTTEAWLDFMISGRDLEPTLFLLEYSIVMCGLANPFDDYLSEVAIPVYNWGAAGGIGPYGSEMSTVLSSADWSEHIVSLRPPEEVLLDFGHIDLFTAENAPELAWDPLLDWMKQLRHDDEGDDEGDDEMDDEQCDGHGGQSASDDDSPAHRRHDTRRLGLR